VREKLNREVKNSVYMKFEWNILKRDSAYLTGASLFMFYEIFEVFELCHTFTYFPNVPCLSSVVSQLHLLSRCAVFESVSVTFTLAYQMCPVWGQHCLSYTCLPDVPCLWPGPKSTCRICELWWFSSRLLKRTLPRDLYKPYYTLSGCS